MFLINLNESERHVKLLVNEYHVSKDNQSGHVLSNQLFQSF